VTASVGEERVVHDRKYGAAVVVEDEAL